MALKKTVWSQSHLRQMQMWSFLIDYNLMTVSLNPTVTFYIHYFGILVLLYQAHK